MFLMKKKKVNVTFKIWAYSARDHLSESLSNVHIRSLEVYVKKHTPKSFIDFAHCTFIISWLVTYNLRNCVFAVINRKLTPSRKSRKLPKLPPEAEKMFKAPLFSKFQMIFYFSSKKINQFFQVLVQKSPFFTR